jgi:GNAT superfamily N-acetyltransferase
MKSVQIRRAAPVEASLITPLCAEHAAFEKADFNSDDHASRLAEMMSGSVPRITILVAEIVDLGPIGYAAVAREASTWRASEYLHLDCLFVREPHREIGVGRQLLDAVVAMAKAYGLVEVQWQTPSWNRRAIHFYRVLGAVPADKVRQGNRVKLR